MPLFWTTHTRFFLNFYPQRSNMLEILECRKLRAAVRTSTPVVTSALRTSTAVDRAARVVHRR
jgi:hypothetical protein